MTRDELEELIDGSLTSYNGVSGIGDAVDKICAKINGFSDLLDGKAVIVPVEPTKDMLFALEQAEEKKGDYYAAYEHMSGEDAWPYMLAASPYRGTE